MDEKIFPKEIIDTSTERNFYKHSVQTRLIYSTICLSLLIVIGLLPLIKVDVGVRGEGIIRPVSETKQIAPIVSGRVKLLAISENDYVEEGDSLLSIASPQVDERLRYNKVRRAQLKRFLSDLEVLLNVDENRLITNHSLYTNRYINSYQEFQKSMRSIIEQKELTKESLKKNEPLFEKGFISEADYLDVLYAHKSKKSDFEQHFAQQLYRWQIEKSDYLEEYERLESKWEELQSEKALYNVAAPANGTIQNLLGITQGSYISPNEVLAEISPDTTLIAEIIVLPQDIGMIKPGMPVRLQVSAFDYNRWGVLEGRVTDISDDVMVSDGQPVYRVRTTLYQTYLSLQNGYQGEVKKGMTVQSRFIITERSLFQLLFDKVDDWLNPTWGSFEPENGYQAIN